MGCSSRKNTTAPWLKLRRNVTCLPYSSLHSSSEFSTKKALLLSQPETSTRYRFTTGLADRIMRASGKLKCRHKAKRPPRIAHKINELCKVQGSCRCARKRQSVETVRN